ncbi:MAG: low molecular weight protein-tyrosine-phosphatase [Gammaproteobacteria bacterium]
MSRLVKLHVLFLFIALCIAFVLIPLDQFYFKDNSVEEIEQYYRDAISFSSGESWQIVFTWFLGLTCGRLIIRAINGKALSVTEPESVSMPKTDQIKVLFVCMGNICRSPTAHGVFQKLVDEDGLRGEIAVDSAGTYAYHEGKAPDSRAVSIAAERGYNLSKLRARKVVEDDFESFDYILAMDGDNHSDLLSQCGSQHKHKIKLFLDFATTTKHSEVPDPYYGDSKGFETVLNLVEATSKELLKHIKRKHINKTHSLS